MYVVKTVGGMGATPPWLALGGIPDQPSQAGQRQPCVHEQGAGTPVLFVRGSGAGALQTRARLEKPVLGFGL